IVENVVADGIADGSPQDGRQIGARGVQVGSGQVGGKELNRVTCLTFSGVEHAVVVSVEKSEALKERPLSRDTPVFKRLAPRLPAAKTHKRPTNGCPATPAPEKRTDSRQIACNHRCLYAP